MLINNMLGGVAVGSVGPRYLGFATGTGSTSSLFDGEPAISAGTYERALLVGDLNQPGFTSQAASSSRYTTSYGLTSRILPVSFPLSGTGLGTVRAVGIFENPTGGEPMVWYPAGASGNSTTSGSTAIVDNDLVMLPAHELEMTHWSGSGTFAFGQNYWNEIRAWLFPATQSGSYTNNLEAKGDATTSLVYAALEGASGEVSGGSYARVSVSLSTLQPASDLSGGVLPVNTTDCPLINFGPITFAQASADWGVVTHVALYPSYDDLQTNGTKPLCRVELDAPQNVTAGKILVTDQTIILPEST